VSAKQGDDANAIEHVDTVNPKKKWHTGPPGATNSSSPTDAEMAIYVKVVKHKKAQLSKAKGSDAGGQPQPIPQNSKPANPSPTRSKKKISENLNSASTFSRPINPDELRVSIAEDKLSYDMERHRELRGSLEEAKDKLRACIRVKVVKIDVKS
jgi:hypothetical protein